VYLAIAEIALNKKQRLFTSKFDLNLRKEPVNCYICCTVIWSWNLDISGSRSEIPGKF
jgi:hypothetical protein